ncbi:hypothetical protein OPQ81_011853 [Rhizoctonia solani]|nr:hypothetical protein OPQ81_011853 [Rhizoctonia solani]
MGSKLGDSPQAEHIHDASGDENVDAETREHLQRLTPEELAVEKKLKKKIDFRIMPPDILRLYTANSAELLNNVVVNRNNYAAARLQGLQDDLGMSDNQYQIGLSTLFVGYVLMQVPSNALLNYAGRPSIYIGFFTTVWGLVSALTSQVKSPGGIIAARFILGFVEAPFFAGILFYLSKWYTKEELSLRMAIFYSGSLISGAFGNLIAAGILNGLAGRRGYAAWQWLYIMEGTITIFHLCTSDRLSDKKKCAPKKQFGLLLMLVLPDFPDTWKSLSDQERHVANRRLAVEAAEADIDEKNGMSHLRGIKLALTDPKTYLLAIAYHGQTGAAGIQNYFPTLTETVTSNHIDALLLCAPPYLFMVVWSFAHSRTSDHLKKRFWFFVYPMPIAIIGFIGNYALSLLVLPSLIGSPPLSPRPPAKRAAAFAFINSVGNAASIWTPFTYRTQDAPYYRPALGICIGLLCISFICALALRLLLQSQNKRLARMDDSSAQLTQKDTRKLQLTAEVEGISLEEARSLQRGFRYVI